MHGPDQKCSAMGQLLQNQFCSENPGAWWVCFAQGPKALECLAAVPEALQSEKAAGKWVQAWVGDN